MSQAVTNRIAVMHLIRLVLVATTIVVFPTHLFAQAELTSTPTSIDFGNQQINVESDPITLTLANIGAESATGIICDVADRPGGNDPEMFTAETCPASLASGYYFTANVTFTPTSVGSQAAQLIVAYHDGSTETTTRVSLDGHGIDCDSDGDGITDSTDPACWGGNPAPAPCTGGDATGCLDNCPAVSNPIQDDFDGDGEGDACELPPLVFQDSFEALPICPAAGSPCALTDTCCTSGCSNLQADPLNCGSCGNVCGGNSQCDSGICIYACEPTCTDGFQPGCCSTGCTDLFSDALNCGACDIVCPSNLCLGGCI